MQLPRYVEKLTTEMKEAGNLEGILLTGLTKDGVDLMESYVDRTGDVQTASFCMLKVVQERAFLVFLAFLAFCDKYPVFLCFLCAFYTFTFMHLADAFIQNDFQKRALQKCIGH